MNNLTDYFIERKKLKEVSELSIADLISAKYNPSLEVVTSITRKDKAKFSLEDTIFIGKYLKEFSGYANEAGILYYTGKIEGKLSVKVQIIYS